jgi:hypothetical protein
MAAEAEAADAQHHTLAHRLRRQPDGDAEDSLRAAVARGRQVQGVDHDAGLIRGDRARRRQHRHRTARAQVCHHLVFADVLEQGIAGLAAHQHGRAAQVARRQLDVAPLRVDARPGASGEQHSGERAAGGNEPACARRCRGVHAFSPDGRC